MRTDGATSKFLTCYRLLEQEHSGRNRFGIEKSRIQVGYVTFRYTVRYESEVQGKDSGHRTWGNFNIRMVI